MASEANELTLLEKVNAVGAVTVETIHDLSPRSSVILIVDGLEVDGQCLSCFMSSDMTEEHRTFMLKASLDKVKGE